MPKQFPQDSNSYQFSNLKGGRVKKKSIISVVPVEVIQNKIYLIRCQKVMLASDLASLYGAPTKSLNLAVKRNLIRFPKDFMFQLTIKKSKT